MLRLPTHFSILSCVIPTSCDMAILSNQQVRYKLFDRLWPGNWFNRGGLVVRDIRVVPPAADIKE